MKDEKYYERRLSDEAREVYETLLRVLTDHQEYIVVPTELAPEESIGNAIVKAVDLDNPQLYYVRFDDLCILPPEELGIPNFWAGYGSYYMSEEVCAKIDSLIAAETSDLLIEAAKEKTFEGRYRKLYNWLLKRCSTGWCTEYKEQFPDAANSIIGPFILEETMCEGYAKAFKYLCDKLNEMLPADQRCECIVAAEYSDAPGKNDIGHAWNIIIKNEQEKLHCDLAYEPSDEELHGRYFMISEEELHKKRMIDRNKASRAAKDPKMHELSGNSAEAPVSFAKEKSRDCNDHIAINGNIYINGDVNLFFNSFKNDRLQAYPADAIVVEAVEVEE